MERAIEGLVLFGMWVLLYLFAAWRKAKLKLESDAFTANQQLELASAYEAALASGKKSEALSVGRQFYASLRDDGILTTYDEQALANDLLAMRDTKK